VVINKEGLNEERLEKLNILGEYFIAIGIGVMSSFIFNFSVYYSARRLPSALTNLILEFGLFVVPFIVTFKIIRRANKELKWAVLSGLISSAVTFPILLLLVARAMGRYR